MVVRFKLDENIPGDAAALLRAAGHEVQSVVDEHLEGTPDAQLLDACRNESRLLITLDLDFADIRAYPPSGHAGIWVLRPHAQNIEAILTVLRGAVALLAKEPAHRRLWIVEHDRVRIRDD
jgi:predicted nuclease of predicted toxin-antitoxin system